MSKGKKSTAKSAPAQDSNWEETLKGDKLVQDDWNPYVLFLDIEDVSIEDHVTALMSVVSKGYRRKFGWISKDELIPQAKADLQQVQAAPSGGKKSKQPNASSSQVPHIAVCEHAVTAAEQGTLTESLVAKLLKYRMLRMKSNELQKRVAKLAAPKEASKPTKPSATKKGGGKSAGKGKGKNTPAEPESSVPMPSLPPSTMKKRGEEGDGPPPINDEPEEGPDYYYVLSGFSSLRVFAQLEMIGIKANALCKMRSPDPQAVEAERMAKKPLSPLKTSTVEQSEEDEAELEEKARKKEQHQMSLDDFWRNIGYLVQLTDTGSMLRDMAQVEIDPPKALVPEKTDDKEQYGLEFFQKLASLVYGLLDSYDQYKRFLDYVHFTDLSPPTLSQDQELFLTPSPSTTVLPTADKSTPSTGAPVATQKKGLVPEVNRQSYYNEVLREVPQECISVPMVLFGMVEQVVNTVEGSQPGKVKNSVPSVVDSCVFSNFVSQLALPDDQKKTLMSEEGTVEKVPVEKSPAVFPNEDNVTQRHHHLTGSALPIDLVAAERHILQLSMHARLTNKPTLTEKDDCVVQANFHSLQHFVNAAELSPELLHSSLLQLAFEQVPCSSSSCDPELKRLKETSGDPLQDSPVISVDYPLELELVDENDEPLSANTALAVCSEAQLHSDASQEQHASIPVLKLSSVPSSLVHYSARERLKRDTLLQELLKSSHRKPYLESYYHKLCNALLLVSHSGLPRDTVGSYTWEKQMLSPFGFNNYLQFVPSDYEDEIDRVWSLDEERREIEEEEWKKMAEEKLKEKLAAEAAAEDTSKDGKKKSAKGSGDKKGKKGKESAMDNKSAQEPSPVMEEFRFKRSTAFPGYRVGDKVLLYKSTVSTIHCSDQNQVKVITTHPSGASQATCCSVVGESAVMNLTVVLANAQKAAIEELKNKLFAPQPDQQSETPPDKPENGEGAEGEKKVHTEEGVDANKPTPNKLQPPTGIEQATLSASLGEDLHFSISHFGPRGDGSLPLPPEPDLKPTESDGDDQGSRPGSTKQSVTPRKMSKKEQEAYQQQLLEQQKQLEKERKEKKEKMMKEWKKTVEKVTAANQIQQLNLTTESGLHLQCQILPPAQAGGSNQIVVRQKYPTKTTGSQPCERYRLGAYNLQSYVLYPDGTLCMMDGEGASSILCPDGTIYRSPTTTEMKRFQAYLLSKDARSTEDHLKLSEGETEGVGRSTSRVGFSGLREGEGGDSRVDKMASRDEEENSVWVVSLPGGEQYMWRKLDSPNAGGRAAAHDVITEESTGQSEPATEEEKELSQSEEYTDVCMPLQSLGINVSTDPVTKEEMLVREDGLMIVRHPSGSVIVDHPNSTRFTTAYTGSGEVESVDVEYLGFARVKYSHPAGSATITLPNASSVSCTPEGEYSVAKEGSGSVVFSKDGVATLQSDSCMYQVNYGMKGVEDAVLRCCQVEQEQKLLFSVGVTGEITQHTSVPLSPSMHSPEYYILDEKEDVYRLLPAAQLEEALKKTSSDSKVVLQDVFPGDSMQKSITVLESTNSSDPIHHVVPFTREDIVPPNLKKASMPNEERPPSNKKPRFGVSVGKGLMIGSLERPSPPKPVPKVGALMYRQFVNPYQEPEKLRTALVACLTKYACWKNEHQETMKDIQPTDARSDEEKEKVTQLQATAKEGLTQNNGLSLSGKGTESALWKAYIDQLTGVQEGKVSQESISIKSTHSTLKQEEDAKEREDAEAAKLALRSGTIPKYFSSTQGQSFLAMQPPDLQSLTMKLAQPKLSQSYKAKVSFEEDYISKSPVEERDGSGFTTPSTTCSTAVPMGETNSPSPSELGQMANVTTLRPQNPTPYHADGKGTPTESRPLNPTPGHASRDAMTLRVSSSEKSPSNNPSSLLGYVAANGQGELHQGNYVISERLGEYNEGESQVADTIAALDQEETVAGSEINQFESKDLDEVDPPKRINNSTYFTVTGERRKTEVQVPDSLMGSRPGEMPNKHFTAVEEPVRRKVMTSSVAKPLTAGLKTMPEMRGFELHPKEVAFGVLKEGCVYGYTVIIKNIGVDSCRFKIKQPPPSTGLKVRYTPGPLAAGLKTTFDIEIYAMAVGAIGDSGIGAVRHVLKIITETSHLHLPITAIILTQSAYEKRLPIHPQGKHSQDVKLLSERPASRERIDRPSKEDNNA